MMAAKELKKAAETLACPICYQVFRNPKYLPCHHSCCEECLEKMQIESKITCPECRFEAIVPEGGVKDLPNNFLINRLVDELILKRKVDGEEEVHCDNCEEDDPVVSYCLDCGDFLCHVCNESHKRDKRSRGHKIIPLTELRSNKDAGLQVKAKIPPCKEHDYELNHYCETCEQLVCLYCTTKKHKEHSHDTVKNMAAKHRQELGEITAPVEGMITGLAEVHDNIDKMRKNIKQRGDEVDREIDQYYDELVRKLMEQKQQIKQQLHETVSQNEKAVTVQLEEIEIAQGEVCSMKELKDAVEKSSDAEALSAKQQIILRMKQLSEKYNNLDTHPVRTAAIQFLTNRQPLPQFSQLKFDALGRDFQSFVAATNTAAGKSNARVLPLGNYRSSDIWQPRAQKSRLPRARRTESLELPLSTLPPGPLLVGPVERQKCRQCKEFFANEEYGARGLCSGCFKKVTIEESTQKPVHQSNLPPGRIFSYPPSHAQCKSMGCRQNAAVGCQGYCEKCYFVNHGQFQQ